MDRKSEKRSGTDNEDDPGTLVTEQVKSHAQQMVHQGQQTAGQVASQAQQQASSAFESQKVKATDSLGGVSTALRQTGETLRKQNQSPVAHVAETAADQVDRVASFIQQRNLTDMIGEVENFGRRSPVLFLGGALVAGFLGARFIKSSSPKESGAGYGGYSGGSSNYGRYGSPRATQDRYTAAGSAYPQGESIQGFPSAVGNYGGAPIMPETDEVSARTDFTSSTARDIGTTGADAPSTGE